MATSLSCPCHGHALVASLRSACKVSCGGNTRKNACNFSSSRKEIGGGALLLCKSDRSSRKASATIRVKNDIVEPEPLPPSLSVDASKEDLASKLAAAEAEADALRRELASRRAEKIADLTRPTPKAPAKRIDGTGFRETLFDGKERATGRPEQQMAKWGLSEAELFFSKDAPTEGLGLGGPAMEENAQGIVARRLLIGLAATGVTIGLALFKLPAVLTKPTKPLFFYLVPIIRLANVLKALSNEDTATDVSSIRDELKGAVGPAGALKENLLSVVALLEGAEADKAERLAFEILEYLDQADYTRYFEYRGKPSADQQVEFLKFSLQSLKV
eukprot:jgi/Mesen1/956/ME000012S00507